MAKLKFAIVGVGNIAPIPATATQNTPDCELAAAVTRNAERSRAFVDQYGGNGLPIIAPYSRATMSTLCRSRIRYTPNPR